MNKLRYEALLDILRRENVISPSLLVEGHEYLENNIDPLDEMFKNDLITKSDIKNALIEYYNTPEVDLELIKVQEDFSELFGLDLLTKYQFVPVYHYNNGLWIIATVNPNNPILRQLLGSLLGNHFDLIIVEKEKLDGFLNIYSAMIKTKNALKSIQSEANIANNSRKDVSTDVANAPAVRFIDSTLEEAVKLGASDIHVEPSETVVNVRYRIDGDLYQHAQFDMSFFPAISTRIKILSDIDIAEKRIPQDGHITKEIGNERVDFRVSTLPTIHGEKIVIRVLDKKIFSLSLKELNFSQEVQDMIHKILKHPHGIILLTGPTGSGKTTTLYSFLKELNKPNVNIVTIEDPVEYSMESINQIQINTKADLTFASSLRSILRQDPDIIMVGEIRDEETAQIAIRAAITGHLVLSTLHTNEAPGAVTRLIDMGVPAYLVSDALVAVISQRLLKRLCPYCKRPVTTTADQRRALGLKEDITIYEANGCPYCNNTGYKGRMAVHEIMYLNDDLKEAISRPNITMEEIRDISIKKAGMVTLANAAKKFVIQGETGYSDLLSMIVSEERERKK